MLLYLVIEEKRTPAVFLSYSLVSDNKSRLLLHLVRVFSRYSARPSLNLPRNWIAFQSGIIVTDSSIHRDVTTNQECCCHGSISGIHQVVSINIRRLLAKKMNSSSFIKLNHLDGKSSIKKNVSPLFFLILKRSNLSSWTVMVQYPASSSRLTAWFAITRENRFGRDERFVLLHYIKNIYCRP